MTLDTTLTTFVAYPYFFFLWDRRHLACQYTKNLSVNIFLKVYSTFGPVFPYAT